MMDLPNITQDDLMDVMELTQKLEETIAEILSENEMNIAMSSLMGASINCMLGQCDTLQEVMFYRNLFMQILDAAIKDIKIKGPEKGPPS